MYHPHHQAGMNALKSVTKCITCPLLISVSQATKVDTGMPSNSLTSMSSYFVSKQNVLCCAQALTIEKIHANITMILPCVVNAHCKRTNITALCTYNFYPQCGSSQETHHNKILCRKDMSLMICVNERHIAPKAKFMTYSIAILKKSVHSEQRNIQNKNTYI